MKPVIIDAATIFDPARLLAILAAVDIRYSEVWVSQRYDHFKEKDFITGFGTDSKFALLPDSKGNYKANPVEAPLTDEKLDPKAWITGPRILRWALDKGMVVPKDLFSYEELAIELEKKYSLNNLSEAIMLGPPAEFDIRAGKEFTENYLRKTGKESLGAEYAWRLEPYGIGHGLGLILAAAKEEGAEPFISHPNFADSISTHNYTFYKREDQIELASKQEGSQSDINIKGSIKDAKTIIMSPEALSIFEISEFLNQTDRVKLIPGIITASEDLETRGRDIGIISSKFVMTYVADFTLFSGVPVATGLVTLYDAGARYFKNEME